MKWMTNKWDNNFNKKLNKIIYCAPVLDEVYLVTAFVPSDTACLANSPGKIKRTAVWISLEERVDFLLFFNTK